MFYSKILRNNSRQLFFRLPPLFLVFCLPSYPFYKKVEKNRQKVYNRNAMKNTTITADIYQVNDSLFHKIFDTPGNARDFLERVLPGELKNQLDLENIDLVVFLLEYVSQTQEISRDQLKKMLNESRIDGGEIMPTLAQQMKEEFMQTLGSQLKDEGKKEKAKETAKELIKRGIDMDIIEGATGISREELDKMASIFQ